ncbi:hypothetical protein [Haloterrigena gelatinilytica]|uniref:hypothetical protein n=1 Tax=Haloterrigena gelatinilytica TaxID=2741724 RepID=UPI0020C6E55F|nr:hypothetical protein [Haloterrigena gelatinilytica]
MFLEVDTAPDTAVTFLVFRVVEQLRTSSASLRKHQYDRELSASTAPTYYDYVRAFLSFAVRDGYIDTNPANRNDADECTGARVDTMLNRTSIDELLREHEVPSPSLSTNGARSILQRLSEHLDVAYDDLKYDPDNGEYLKPHDARRGIGHELYKKGRAEVAQKSLRHTSMDVPTSPIRTFRPVRQRRLSTRSSRTAAIDRPMNSLADLPPHAVLTLSEFLEITGQSYVLVRFVPVLYGEPVAGHPVNADGVFRFVHSISPPDSKSLVFPFHGEATNVSHQNPDSFSVLLVALRSLSFAR